jgi:hypothetical protein
MIGAIHGKRVYKSTIRWPQVSVEARASRLQDAFSLRRFAAEHHIQCRRYIQRSATHASSHPISSLDTVALYPV